MGNEIAIIVYTVFLKSNLKLTHLYNSSVLLLWNNLALERSSKYKEKGTLMVAVRFKI